MDAAASQWPGLLSDLLRDISGRLRDPADFVRFHAVCKPWRDTAAATPRPSSSSFLPWLVAPGGSWRTPGPLFRSVFSSNTAWRAHRAFSSGHKWLACADGAGTWLRLSDGGGEAPCLVDPLTGAVTARLPHFRGKNVAYSLLYVSDGVVFADGTIVLYNVHEFVKNVSVVVAAVLRPGDAAWTVVDEQLVTSADSCFRSAPALINGEIVFAADLGHLCVVKLRAAGGLADVTQTRCELLDDPAAGELAWSSYFYTFESRSELLSVHVRVVNAGEITYPIVLIGEDWRSTGLNTTLSASLYALDLGTDDGNRPRWVRRDGRSLADRVLFLGRPASFAVDAARFDGAIAGGCAYVVLGSNRFVWTALPEAYQVYKYSFLDGSATDVADLPERWDTGMSIMWFVPQPVSIASTQEIRERLQAASNNSASRSITLHVKEPPRQFGPYFKIYVGNLPWKVDSSRLRQFFSGHGQVSDARVINDRETGRSRGFGFVIMATLEEPAAAVVALNGKILDGRALRVNFAEERPRQDLYMPPLFIPQYPIYWWWW
ncbi:hypothetical protein EJB05_43973, partial [Eragrostis curvula]